MITIVTKLDLKHNGKVIPLVMLEDVQELVLDAAKIYATNGERAGEVAATAFTHLKDQLGITEQQAIDHFHKE